MLRGVGPEAQASWLTAPADDPENQSLPQLVPRTDPSHVYVSRFSKCAEGDSASSIDDADVC